MTDWASFSRESKRLLWGPLLPVLDELCGPGGCGWNDGGCRVLAEAYMLWLPGAERVVLVGWSNPLYTKLQVQHVLVRVADRYIDGDGACTLNSLVRRWRVREGIKNLQLLSDPGASLSNKSKDIPVRPELSRRLADVLRVNLAKYL